MNTIVCNDVRDLGRRAAADAAERIRRAVRDRGRANIIVATGASQFEVLAALVAAAEIDWAASAVSISMNMSACPRRTRRRSAAISRSGSSIACPWENSITSTGRPSRRRSAAAWET